MADVPIYKPSIPVQAPGVPHPQVEAMSPAVSSAGVFEAAAGIGKTVEEMGSRLEQHMVMMDKIEAQQRGYDAAAKYSQALQNVVATEKQKYGMDAQGSQARLQTIINGKPAIPSTSASDNYGRAVPPLREKFSEGLGALALKSFDRTADAHETVANGQLINHEITQVNKAMEQNSTVTISKQIDAGNNIHYPAEMQIAQKQFAAIIDNDQWLKSQHTPQDLANMKQGFLDKQAQAAVAAAAPMSYEKAQKLLDAAQVSPGMKTHLQNNVVNGARTDQYTEALTKSIVNDPAMRAPNGEIDEAKAVSTMQKQIAEQEAGPNPLPPGHADMMMGKVQSNIAIHNKAITQQQQLVLTKASNDIYGAQQGGMSATDAYAKFIKQGQFDNAIERGKAEDVFTKVYEKDPSALDTVWAHMSEAQKTTVSTITNSKEFLDKFPYADERKTFEDTFKQKILEGHVQNPDAINKLYQDQFSKAPTGAPRFMGMGKQELPKYEIDQTLQKNQPVVKAVGGLANAATLAQALGGPAKLAPDTNESKAVMLLAQYGKPINAATISQVITKHPDLLK